MPRWEPDPVERLQAAAFELFADQGFERTTVAEPTQPPAGQQRSTPVITTFITGSSE